MLLYFALPLKKCKWTVLLAASVFFYAVAGYKYAFFILFTSLNTYLIALWIQRVTDKSKALLKAKKSEWDRNQKPRKNRSAKEPVKASAFCFVLPADNPGSYQHLRSACTSAV